jgi:hypothetical protein
MFGEKTYNWLKGLATIPVIGVIGTMIFDKITEKTASTIQKRLEKILGLGVEEANKDITDELIYCAAVNGLDVADVSAIDAFEERLRREEPDKAQAFVLFVAKLVSQFEREERPGNHNKKKGDPEPSKTQIYKNLDEGFKHAKKFLEALLRNKTFAKRVAFLQGKNVFSLIKPKSKESVFEKKAEEIVTKAYEGVKAGVKTGAGAIVENLSSIPGEAKSFRERARAYRASQGGK